MRVDDKVALVTGGGQGIGKTIALKLAAAGADIAIVDVNEDQAKECAAEVEAMGKKAIAIKANVTDLAEATAAVQKTNEELGGVHILVNNAGITRDGLLLRMKEEDWDLVLNVNLKGAFNFCKAAVRVMSKQRHGRIVNIASVVGQIGNAGQANYAASKAGLIGLTKTIAREFAGRDITCNAVAPGFIETAMTDALSDDMKEKLSAQIPMGRLGSVDDVANGVLFLSCPASNYITGHVLNINGGMNMG
ncbi:MAG: 3-oxoacyl-[acyl-carrier-protein] reductase [Thermodesulfobacteriota bacterium]